MSSDDYARYWSWVREEEQRECVGNITALAPQSVFTMRALSSSLCTVRFANNMNFARWHFQCDTQLYPRHGCIEAAKKCKG